jgi:TAG lipase / steryl ester hydrolase / phospholipase A2 / LPA acyltransferase
VQSSPNVYVRAAVMASCAVPGVFPPVMLMAKNQHGERQPYLPTRKWVDGSIADDLPAKRLQRLYRTNQVDLGSRRGFLVSSRAA